MNAEKIVLILALLVSVVGAFVAIPYIGLVLIILGLVKGVIGVDESARLFFLVMAVALAGVTGALGEIPMVGAYITNILSSISAFINAAVVAVIVTVIIEKAKP